MKIPVRVLSRAGGSCRVISYTGKTLLQICKCAHICWTCSLLTFICLVTLCYLFPLLPSPPSLFTSLPSTQSLSSTFFPAPAKWRQLQLSQLPSSSNPTCRQRRRPTQRSHTFALRRSPCFRAQSSGSSSQSFPAPTSAFTSPCWGRHQGHRNYIWCHTKRRRCTHFRQAFTSHPAASQDPRKRGRQVWDDGAARGRGRVRFKEIVNCFIMLSYVLVIVFC